MIYTPKTARRTLQFVVIGLQYIVLFVITAVVLYYMSRWLQSVFSGVQKEVQAALVAASATVIVSVLSVVVGKYYERKRAIEQQIRDKKIPIYEKFVKDSMRHFMPAGKNQSTDSDGKLLNDLGEFTIDAVIWGSDDVLSSWRKFKKVVGNDAKEGMLEFEILLYAIRQDLGHKSRKLNRGDILGLFINDIDQVLETLTPLKQPTEIPHAAPHKRL